MQEYNPAIFVIENDINNRVRPIRDDSTLNYFEKAKEKSSNPFMDMGPEEVKKVIAKLDQINEKLEASHDNMARLLEYRPGRFGRNTFTDNPNDALQYFLGLMRKAHKVWDNPNKNNFSIYQIKNLNLILRKLGLGELKFNKLG